MDPLFAIPVSSALGSANSRSLEILMYSWLCNNQVGPLVFSKVQMRGTIAVKQPWFELLQPWLGKWGMFLYYCRWTCDVEDIQYMILRITIFETTINHKHINSDEYLVLMAAWRCNSRCARIWLAHQFCSELCSSTSIITIDSNVL